MSLPGWQALHHEIEPFGATVVTVAMDVQPERAHRYIDAVAPTHPALVDPEQHTVGAFGFVNIPMSVWIDEDGIIVRNAEAGSVEPSPFRNRPVPEGLPERLTALLTEVGKMPDDSESYRAAILDWVANGERSPFALSATEVVERSRPRGRAESEAAACFELGERLRRSHGLQAAIPWWRRAHQLDPGNIVFKRQAYTLSTTPADAEENDLIQEAGEVYGRGFTDDLLSIGGEHITQRYRP